MFTLKKNCISYLLCFALPLLKARMYDFSMLVELCLSFCFSFSNENISYLNTIEARVWLNVMLIVVPLSAWVTTLEYTQLNISYSFLETKELCHFLSWGLLWSYHNAFAFSVCSRDYQTETVGGRLTNVSFLFPFFIWACATWTRQ